MRKLTVLAAVLAGSLMMTACGGKKAEETTAAVTTAAEETTKAAEETTTEETTEAESTEKETAEETAEAEAVDGLRIGQAEVNASGDKSFAIVTAVIDEKDTVVASYIDEYQFFSTKEKGVPNSDKFIESGAVTEGKVLASKRANNEFYSEMLKKAGSTKSIAENFDGIQEYAKGKTIEELEALAGKTPEEAVDAVSSATLTSTPGYISAIAEAAKAAKENPAVPYEGERENLQLKRVDTAAHGDKAFTVASALTDGDTVVLSYIDEYQFLSTSEIGVPNNDKFIENGAVAEGKALASKRMNHEFYSEMMKKAGATKDIAESFDLIQNYANGKTIEELEALAGKTPEEAVDAVSGATLTDTQGYVAAIVEAAQQ